MDMKVTATPEDVGLSTSRLARLRPWIRRYVDGGMLAGALILVARRGQIGFLDCVGFRDRGTQQPMTLDTLFRIYSMTKPITSVAIMMLYEEGFFQLDDPVGRYIPCFTDMAVYVSGEGEGMRTEPANDRITIHQLLTHTSGLIYSFAQSPVAELYRSQRTDFGPRDGSLSEVVDRLARLPLACHPGEAWHYGVSTDVLGRLVEVVSGQSYDDFLAQRIFRPLGMEDTSFAVPRDKLHRFAALYGPVEGGGMELVEAPAHSRFLGEVGTLSGGAGLIASAHDYYRFTEMLRRKGELDGVRLLGRKTVEYMTSNQLPGDLAEMGQPSFNETTFEGVGFGLGFSVMLDPAKAKVLGTPGEYAWGGMASTAFWIDPLEDMTVIFMTQLTPSDAYPLRRELRVLSYQALID